jgi:hypothetical protein
VQQGLEQGSLAFKRHFDPLAFFAFHLITQVVTYRHLRIVPLEKGSMAGRGTIDHGLDDGHGGNAGLAKFAGYCFDGWTSRDPVIGSALGGAGGAGGGPDRIDGAGGAYVEAVGSNTSGMATGGAGGTSTSGGAGGGGYIYGGYGRYSDAGGYGGAGAVIAEYGGTGKARH